MAIHSVCSPQLVCVQSAEILQSSAYMLMYLQLNLLQTYRHVCRRLKWQTETVCPRLPLNSI